ncbi:MAG: 4-hydroxybenzoate octaprenyltransferase [Pseudomonadota bacterium]
MILNYLKLIRLHQPVGIFLLLWPCLISLNMASLGIFNIGLTLLFIIGSILMRSAGCIINDLVDYDFDGKVERTKERPLVSGKISKRQAVILLIILLLLASSLLFFLNRLAILICLSSITLIILYPFCKRFTYWPQLILGITFNIGVLVAWANVRGGLDLPAILLYIGSVFWTLGYDTIYAYQDIKYDLELGIKSTAIKFGEKGKKYINSFYTIAATMFVFAGNIGGLGMHFNAMMIVPVILLFWQVRTIDIENPKNCGIRFKSNILIGGLIYLATILARLV